MTNTASNLANVYEETMQSLWNKLNRMLWKFQEFEKNIINLRNDASADEASAMSLIQSMYNVRDDYESIMQDAALMDQTYNEMRVAVTEEMNAVLTQFNALKINVMENFNNKN